jgi:hypothetical protein
VLHCTGIRRRFACSSEDSGEELLCLVASISEERKRARKRGVGGLIGKVLRGGGGVTGGVIAGSFRNRERRKNSGEEMMPTCGTRLAVREGEDGEGLGRFRC